MGTQETIVVVEDDPDVRTLHRLWLTDEYDVRTAKDGESAIAAADTDIAVVLLDRNLPGLSGDDVTRRLRSDGYDGVIAMVTANPPDQSIVELAVDEYVTKPVSGTELRALVDRSLARLEMPAVVRELFGLVSRRARLRARADQTGLSEADTLQSLENRIDDQYRQAVENGISSRRLSELAVVGLAEDVNLADPLRDQQQSLRVNATSGAGHEF